MTLSLNWKIPGFINALLWLLTLLTGYITTRTFCIFGLPVDCKFFSVRDHLICAGNLFCLGFFLGWLTGVYSNPRFLKIPWMMTFLLTLPIFSAASEISILDRSVESDEELPLSFKIALLGIACVVFILVAWHYVHSMHILSANAFRRFWISRFIGISTIAGIFFLAEIGDFPRIHLHHYFLAFTISSIAAFDHPISSTMLAVCTGIFVQGVAAYSADNIVKPGNLN